MATRLSIAEDLLGAPVLAGGYAPCPGKDRHTHKSGPRDFRVLLDGAPTGYCVHRSCGDDVADFNKQLRREIFFLENDLRGDHRVARARDWGIADLPDVDLK